MRWMVLFLLLVGSPLLADDTSASELKKLQAEEAEIRQAAAADPTVKDADSLPIKVYLAEQKRRRLTGIASLQQRIAKAHGDKSKETLLPVWKDQLAALESKPLDEVSFDSAYDYKPTTGC